MLRLEDLIPAYPAADDPQIQRKLNQYPEFAKLRGSVREPIPERGQYFSHQRLITRYLRVYDRIFLLHMMGTGKTGTVKSASGFFKYKYYPLPPATPRGPGLRDADVDVVGFPDPGAQIALGLPPPDVFGRVAPGLPDPTASPGVSVSVFVDALVEFMGDADTDIRHAYIIVKGPGLKREFERQITCELADPGEFDAVFRASRDANSNERLRQLRKKLSQWYTIETSRVFVRRYLCRREGGQNVLLPDEELRRRFSGCLFFVDEVQALYNEARDGAPARRRGLGNAITRGHRDRDEDFKFVYDALEHLFNIVERSKVIIGSGTPMMNGANEIKSPMNLILPPNMKMPRSMNVETMSLKELEPYFRGRVSYVRELETGAVPVQMGDHFLMNLDGEEVETSERVYMSTMSEFQSSVYERTMMGDFDGIEVVDSREESPTTRVEGVEVPLMLAGMDADEGNIEDIQAQIMAELASMQAAMGASTVGRGVTHFHGAEMNASVFVFPDGSLEGKVTEGDGSRMAPSGLGRYVYSPKRGTYFATPEYRELINTPDKLRRFSCIYADIVQMAIDRPNEKAFIYLGDRVQGAGAINLSVCFAANGFEHYHPSPGDVIDNSRSGGLCGAPVERRAVRGAAARGINLTPGPRFALLTNYTTQAEQNMIMELWNAPENMHGEYLSIIISSTVGGTGLNFNNTVRGHFLPGWNASGMQQAIARILRTTSHVGLLEEKRAEIAARGGNPDDAYVAVEIYRHAAVPLNDEVPSIDLQLYAISERKDRQIRRIMRIMKQSAIDCVINYHRNVRPGVDGSPECDYDVCVYECAAPPLPGVADPDLRAPPPPSRGPAPAPVLSPTQLILAPQESARVGEALLNHIQRHGPTRLTELARALSEPINTVSSAAYALQNEERVVLDTYGFPCTVRVLDHPAASHNVTTHPNAFQDVIVALHRSFTFARGQDTDPYDAYYTTSLHVATVAPQITNAILDTAMFSGADAAIEVEEHARRLNADLRQIESMPATMQVELFEMATEILLSSKTEEESIMTLSTANKLAWMFARYFYTVVEPTADLARAESDLVRRGKGRGRKSRADAPLIISFQVEPTSVLEGAPALLKLRSCARNESACRSEHRVFLHIMNSRNFERTSYAVAAQFKGVKDTIRVMSMRDRVPRWRDATISETPVYRALIQRHREELLEQYGDLFGSLLDGKFRVHDRLASKAGARSSAEPRNRREEARGRVCTTWPLEHLVTLAFRAGLPGASESYVRESSALPREQLDRELTEFTKRLPSAVRALPDDQAAYEHAWWTQFHARRGKVKDAVNELCGALQERFTYEGKLIRV